ncbi:hypothetical protein [Pseudolabrys sp.]|uniref:hypothetical protein n=1 Tax=Pseudolabrys sp. TaxID=1960880 RepID=UPI003D1238DD
MSKKLADVDPGVKIPPAVAAAGSAAEELHKKVYSKEEPAEPPVAAPAEPPAGPPADPALTAEPPPADPAGLPTEPKPSEGQEDWKHKYQSMKGRYDRLEKRVNEVLEHNANLERLLATTKVRQPDEPSPTVQAPKLITPEEEQSYGDEFLSVVGKKAQEVFLPEVEQLKKRLEHLQTKMGAVGEYVAQTDRTRMLDKLNERVPNWKELNTNEQFLEWLSLKDTFSGVTRQDLLNQAYEQNETPRVLAFFEGFLAEEAAVAPRHNEPAQEQPAPTKIPLETFAAPGRAKTAAAHAPAEKPLITRSEITRFYTDVAAGKYRGRDEEKKRFEKQIFEAEREGRIR